MTTRSVSVSTVPNMAMARERDINWWWVFVVGLVLLFLLTHCGKTVPGTGTLCSLEYEPTVTKSFGTLEHMACDPNQVMLAVDPKWLAGGTITHVEVQCAKVRVKCE